jgi:hypothetical protein
VANALGKLKQFGKRKIEAAGYQVTRIHSRYAQDGLVTVHNDHFRGVDRFKAAYARGVQASHGVDPKFEWRAHVALWAAGTAMRTRGDFVECGVNAGFMSSAIMHWLDWNRIGRRFYLVDTWEGPPVAQFNAAEVSRGRLQLAQEAIASGAYVTDIDRVRRNYAEWPMAIMVQGMVPDALPRVTSGEIAFLHLDMNCAYPEQAALLHFWDRLSTGGVVLFDDYTYHGYEQQTAAIDEIAAQLDVDVLSLPTGQGLIVK